MGDCACYAQDLTWANKNQLVFAFVELTPACDHRCPGCSNVYLDQRIRPPLPASRWDQVWQRLRPHVELVKITGGDPSLHPEFPTIVAQLGAWALPFVLFTHAHWRDPDAVLSVLRHAQGLRGLLVSLHGTTAAAHEAFTGVKGSFEATLANVRRALDGGIATTLSVVITRFNWDQMAQLVELAQRLGAQGVAVNRYIGAPLPALEPTPEQLRQAIQSVQSLQRAGAPVHWGVPLPLCWDEGTSTPCLAGEAFVTIDPWGKVRPCNHVSVCFGDIFEQPLPAILQSPAARTRQELIPPACADCVISHLCRGNCRAEMLLRPASSYLWAPRVREKALKSPV